MSAQWFVNIDPSKPGDACWMPYSAKDNEKLEKAHARKSKTCTLSDVYRVDFASMRQIRRDDADRWRAIKRGGSATDKAPATGDADDDDAVPAAAAAAPAAAAAAPAPAPVAAPVAAPAAAAATVADKDDAETAPAAAARAPSKAKASKKVAAAAAAAAPAEPASSSVDAADSRVAEDLRAELRSLRLQLEDVEKEQDEAAAKHKLELSAAAIEAARELAAAVSAVKATAAAETKAARDTADKATAELKSTAAELKSTAAELKTAAADLKKSQAELKAASAKLDDAKTESHVLKMRVHHAEAEALKATQAVGELASLRSRYTTLITAIKPVAEAFGIATTTPIGRAIIDFEKNGVRGDAAAQAPAAAAAAAAAPAPAAKKRGRDEDDDAEPRADSNWVAQPVKRLRPAVEAPPPEEESPSSPTPPVSPVPVDDDATQPMVAPASDDAMSDTEEVKAPAPKVRAKPLLSKAAPASSAAAAAASKPAAAAAAAVKPATAAAAASSSPRPAAPFLDNPGALSATLCTKPSDPAPLCVAGITDPSGGADATTTLALVGSLGGRIALYEFAPAAKTARALPLDIKRPAHKYANAAARASSAGEDGESYSLHTHVHALLVVPLASSSRTHIVFAGEGRLLRVYALELGVGVVVASAPAKAAPGGSSLKHLAEFDVGEGGWVNCLARLHAPAGSRDAGQLFVGAGVAGLPHCVQVYACGSGSSLLAPTLHKTYPSRSDEMHGLDQLSDGRIVVGGCSGPVAGAAGGEEGGCVELWSWATGAVASSSQLLKHDLRVAAEIGLRCNGVQVLPKADTKSGGDQLLIAYEYCSTGARQMVLYTFDGAVDVSATQIEAKNMPSNDENTFTSVVVSARHPQKAVAMTYGGKLLVYSLSASAAKRLLVTHSAHGECPHEDGTRVCIVSSCAEQSRPLLLTIGGNNELKMWQ